MHPRFGCPVLLLLLLLLAAAAPRSGAAAPSALPPVPGMMLASPWPQQPPPVADLLVSEKLDGVRARWDGQALWTRGGQRIRVPAGFTRGWPAEALDGELWAGRGRFDAVSALVRRADPHDPGWSAVRLWVFDLPGHPGTFEERLAALDALLARHPSPRLARIPQFRLPDARALQARLDAVVAAGGEGLVAHHRHNRYAAGRSPLLFKLKPAADAEAVVIAHLPGKGRYAGLLGALQVRDGQGRVFRLGSGLSDALRRDPPPVGSRVTYRYTERTAAGLPRFPRFLRVRADEPEPPPVPPPPAKTPRTSSRPAPARRARARGGLAPGRGQALAIDADLGSNALPVPRRSPCPVPPLPAPARIRRPRRRAGAWPWPPSPCRQRPAAP